MPWPEGAGRRRRLWRPRLLVFGCRAASAAPERTAESGAADHTDAAASRLPCRAERTRRQAMNRPSGHRRNAIAVVPTAKCATMVRIEDCEFGHVDIIFFAPLACRPARVARRDISLRCRRTERLRQIQMG